MEEVSARLRWAWEPREVTPGRRPVTEIAGIDQRLIGWQSTRRQQIEDALPVLVADYEERQGHPPGERAAYTLDRQAADRTRPPKRKVPRSLSELRERWRASANPGVRRLHRLPAGGTGTGGGRGGAGAGPPGGRRRRGRCRHRRRGVRDERRVQAPAPARRSPAATLPTPCAADPTSPAWTNRSCGPPSTTTPARPANG